MNPQLPHDHNNRPRIAAECLAVADGLRAARVALCKLVAHGHPFVASLPEYSTVLVAGLDVASALEVLAERLGIEH